MCSENRNLDSHGKANTLNISTHGVFYCLSLNVINLLTLLVDVFLCTFYKSHKAFEFDVMYIVVSRRVMESHIEGIWRAMSIQDIRDNHLRSVKLMDS